MWGKHVKANIFMHSYNFSRFITSILSSSPFIIILQKLFLVTMQLTLHIWSKPFLQYIQSYLFAMNNPSFSCTFFVGNLNIPTNLKLHDTGHLHHNIIIDICTKPISKFLRPSCILSFLQFYPEHVQRSNPYDFLYSLSSINQLLLSTLTDSLQMTTAFPEKIIV